MKKQKYIFFCTLFFLLNIVLIITRIGFNKNLILPIFLSTMMEIIFIILLNLINTKKIENIFLLLVIPLGTFFLLAIPLGSVPDEQNHFKRAYEISEGNLISKKGGIDMTNSIPNCVIPKPNPGNYQLLKENLKYKTTDEKVNTIFPNTSLYNFICYIPQTIGIMIGKILKLPTLLVGYCGRIINFMVWILLMFLSIKYIPFLKKFILFISMLPMTLQEAISLSPDALTVSMCIFLISYTLFVTHNKEKISNKDFIILSICTIVTSLCKIVYLPVCLILLIIPNEKFKSTKNKYIKIITLAIIVVILNLTWTKIVSPFLADSKEVVNPDEQIKWIITNPINYIFVILKTLRYNLYFITFSMIGHSLEEFNVSVGHIYPAITVLVMMFLILTETTKKKIQKFNKILSIFMFISVSLLIFTSLYIQWTPPKSSLIEGIQGRYFLPILILIPISIIQNKFISKEKIKTFTKNININKLLATFMLFFDCFALTILFISNY